MKRIDYSQEEGWIGVIYCLSIDMIKSTEAAIKRTIQEQNKFNKYLVKQIVPHIRKLSLDDAIIQFTGDGWLVMTSKERKIPAICCLATIMAHKFQEEMANYTGLSKKSISPLRIAIDSGIDMCVSLPDHSKHWVGDSARKSVRAAGCCRTNEVIVDYNVLRTVVRDFDFEAINLLDRKNEGLCKKMEEDLDIHTLKDIKPEIREDLEYPDWFIYTMYTIGRTEEAIRLSEHATDMFVDLAKRVNIDKKLLVKKWNHLIESIPDYNTSVRFANQIKESDLLPTTRTYNLLIDKSADYNTGRYWLREMEKNNNIPNAHTYNLLITKSSSYYNARSLLDELLEKHIKPNTSIYSNLISMAPSYQEGKELLNNMANNNIHPNLNIYYTILDKAPDYKEAKNITIEMEKQGIPPNIMTYSLLRSMITNFDEAKVLMDEMEKRKIPSDLVF